MEYCKIPRRVLWQTEARSVSATDGSRIVNRLRRIAGQVRGVAQMIEDDRYCIDVLNQVQAIKAALGRAESEILTRHAACCMAKAIASGDAAEQKKTIGQESLRGRDWQN